MTVTIPGLDQTMSVYSPTNNYAAPVASNVACRLALDTRRDRAGPDRSEYGSFRLLLWDPAVDVDDDAQVEVDGARYNLMANTKAPRRGPSGARKFWRASVVAAGG
jgi:hypothetical protein